MTAYYNEFDAYAAQWLRNLIAAGLIAPGDVDERSILEVKPDDLRGYTQCHFFAGIGGWSLALRLAGWPDDRPVWTGSCPCQPFSAAGKQRGSDDERHLWPAFFDLIRECRPRVAFGEQVAGAAGEAWWDHVAADLESQGYAAAAANLCAAGAGAFHIRQRLYWAANGSHVRRREERAERVGGDARDRAEGRASGSELGGRAGRVAHAGCRQVRDSGLTLEGASSGSQGEAHEWERVRPDFGNGGDAGGLGDAGNEGLEGHRADSSASGRYATARPIAEAGIPDPWRDIEWLACSDGKARPTQPCIFPLVDGISGGRVAVGRAVQQTGAALSKEEAEHLVSRVGVLRGAGNAIVPQVAAAFVMAN